MRVVNSDTKLECYAPGIVQVLPQDETVQAKFYTVMMYNGQQVCVHSKSRLVPHGSCWYNWSVFEILIFCSLEHTCIFLIIIILSSLIFSNINTYIIVTPFDGKLFLYFRQLSWETMSWKSANPDLNLQFATLQIFKCKAKGGNDNVIALLW